MKSTRAAIPLLILGLVALLGVGGWGAVHYGMFSSQTKLAKTSTQTTQALVSAETASGGAAAAYLTQMTSVAATLPESKEKAFLGQAGVIALSYLPAPDPVKLLEAEKLKNAFLSGQLELAQNLTASALQDSGKAKQELARAISAKRASDMALEEAAAEARGEAEQKFWFMCIAIAAGALYLWTKLSHISPFALSRAVADMKAGTVEANPNIAALDGALSPFQQLNTKAMVWLRSKFSKVTS